MKTIKIIACVLGFLFVHLNINAQTINFKEVGKIENGRLVLTVDSKTICKALSENLAKISIVTETFTSVDLIKIDLNYFIVFNGNKWKTTFAVVADEGKLMANMGVSCSTSDSSCSNSPDCAPASDVGSCYCTRCSNDATCTKTCTTETLF